MGIIVNMKKKLISVKDEKINHEKNCLVYSSSTNFETSKEITVTKTFDKMNLKEDLIHGIYAFGFEKPSAIQQRAIIPIINGRDVIAQAQSGTGKSSMIAITSCQIVDNYHNNIQTLVLSPTRELAQQTERIVLAVGDFMDIKAHACVGGKSVTEDIRK